MRNFVERSNISRKHGRDRIIINDKFITVDESRIKSCRYVFNLFWKANTNILYVVDDSGRLAGIITDRSLLEQMKENEYNAPAVNRNYSMILDKDVDRVACEAEALFETYHITTGIPVVNENNHICYEVRKEDVWDEQETLKECHDKFDKYEKSYYLGKEITWLRRLLEEQDIVVIGTEERFDSAFGPIIINRDRVQYINDLEDPYEFLCNNNSLLIDMSPVGYRGRWDIYQYCNNGYYWQQFLALTVGLAESECCSIACQRMEDGIISLRDYLQKYLTGGVYFSKRSIFTNACVSYLKKHNFKVVDSGGIYRTESFRFTIKQSGIEVNKARGDAEFNALECTNLVYQLYCLSRKLSEKIVVLNFSFDGKVEATEEEKIRMSAENWKGARNFSVRLCEFEKLYSMGENSKEYLDELTQSIRFNRIRAYENNLVLFKDTNSRLVNIENGVRRTICQPEIYEGTIYFLGGCTVWGWLVEDQYTIPSLIQKYINQSGRKYRVVNLGNNYIQADNLLESIQVEENDIFVLLFPFITDKIQEELPVIEISERFNKCRKEKYDNAECFFNMIQHSGTNGNIIYSEIIFEELEQHLPDDAEGRKQQVNNLYHVFQPDFRDLDILYKYKEYLKELDDRAREAAFDKNKRIGGIVMNCNPFTLGHKYLVEYAAREMDYLYLFVVEEDLSFFLSQIELRW